MNGLTKKTKILSAVAAGALAFAAQSSYAAIGDEIITFDSTAVGVPSPAVTFTYDEFGIGPFGPQTVTQVDSDNNGVLSAGDGFTEMSLFFTNSFSLGGFPLAPQPGQGIDFQILSDVDLTGFVAFDAALNLDVFFTSATGLMTIQDLTPAGAPTTLANMSLDSGTCKITAASSLAQGSCKIRLNFAPVAAGLFVSNLKGDLFNNPDSYLIVDINVDNLTGLSLAYPGFGTTCGGALPVCEQNLGLDHDGSANHVVPTPGSLALLGIGLLGFARSRFGKRKA